MKTLWIRSVHKFLPVTDRRESHEERFPCTYKECFVLLSNRYGISQSYQLIWSGFCSNKWKLYEFGRFIDFSEDSSGQTESTQIHLIPCFLFSLYHSPNGGRQWASQFVVGEMKVEEPISSTHTHTKSTNKIETQQKNTLKQRKKETDFSLDAVPSSPIPNKT